jgi:hypothetical protein
MKRSVSFNALLSLNIGFAIVSALFIYDGAYHLAHAPRIVRESLEAFAGMLSHIAPLGMHGRTYYELRRNAAIREAVFLGLTFAVALFLYPLTKLAMQTDLRRRFFLSLSGLVAFVAVPACWLYIVHATWSIYEPTSFAFAYGYASVLEIIVVGVLLYIVRNQPIGYGGTVCVLHYIFWMVLTLRHLFSPMVGLPLSFVFPWSEIAWLRITRMQPEDTSPLGRPAKTA